MRTIKLSNQKGLSLIEIVASLLILVLTILAILMTNMFCLNLHSLSKNYSLASDAAKSIMEEIKSSDFSMMKDYDKRTYHASGLPKNMIGPFPDQSGAGVSYVEEIDSSEFAIFVSFCWREKDGRVMGEDKNLNGQPDAGEDLNANGKIDSSVQLFTYVVQK